MLRSLNVTSIVFAAVLLMLLSSLPAQSAEKGHYVPGVEGIKAATLPPPGVYFRSYNVFYSASTLNDGKGNEAPVNFDVSVYAMANRLIWMTDKKFLGATFGMDFIVPLVRTDIKIGAAGIDDSKFALGDIYFEPLLLAWHGPKYDAGFGVSFYAPTGQYDKLEPASAGMDFWTTMLTFGATGYFDQQKLWSISALGRYEFNSEKSETKIKPGQDFLIEWGLARNVNKVWDLGVSGYCLWQTTDDSGTGATYDTGVHDRVYSIGPEVSAFIMPAMAFLSVRVLREFSSQDRSEGWTTAVTFTKIF
jgi:hypothetical protein